MHPQRRAPERCHAVVCRGIVVQYASRALLYVDEAAVVHRERLPGLQVNPSQSAMISANNSTYGIIVAARLSSDFAPGQAMVSFNSYVLRNDPLHVYI